VRARITAIFVLLFLISSCTLVLPLSIEDTSAKMELLSTDEYYGQFKTFSEMKAEFGSDYKMLEKKFTNEFTYELKSESDWQKNYVTFSVNRNDSIENFYGNGLQYGLPRYLAKAEIREKRIPMYILGGVIDVSVYLISIFAFY